DGWRPRAALRSLHAREAAMKVQQRRPGQPIVETKVLRQIADAPPRFGMPGRLAEDARFASRRAHQAEQDLDGCGFARAVWSQKAEDLAWQDGQVEVVQRDLAAIRVVQSPDSDC